METEEIRKIAREEAEKVYSQKGTRFGVASVPTHTHNGVDASQINQKDVVQNIKYQAVLTLTTSDEVTIRNVSNISRIAFYGFAQATGKLAYTNGEANFSRCYVLDSTTPTDIDYETYGNAGKDIIYSGNSIYFDGASFGNTTIVTTTDTLIAVSSAGSPQFITLEVRLNPNNTLSLIPVIASGWTLYGSVTIT